jgi:glycolate dehydrogenase FAD-linked subunit
MEAGAELIARARLICGEQHVIARPVALSTYRSDGVKRDGPLPLAAILPGSASEVANVVAACAATGVPHVVRGAGTSTGGDALPVADGVLVVLTRMRRILSIGEGQLTVEPGVPVSAVVPLGVLSWPDGAEPIGTVGGHIAQTPGIANIAALELVKPNGELARLDSRQPGYDLCRAFSGSRGRVGIAAAITLRVVHPQ